MILSEETCRRIADSLERLVAHLDKAKAPLMRRSESGEIQPVAGCVCPVGANATCKSAWCPRRPPLT